MPKSVRSEIDDMISHILYLSTSLKSGNGMNTSEAVSLIQLENIFHDLISKNVNLPSSY